MNNLLPVLLALACAAPAYAANCGNDKPVGGADCTPGGGNPGNPGNPGGAVGGAAQSAANAGAIAGAAAGAIAISGPSASLSSATSGPSTSSATTGASTSSATGGQGGVGYGGSAAGGSATASAGSASVGDVNVNVSTPAQAAQPSTVTVKNTPDANVLIASPTAVCRISFGAGGSGPGIGLSFGASMLDEGCDAREDARLLRNMGLLAEAILRLCAKPEMAAALGTKCPAKQ
jgi:hypothetical protein